MDSKEPEQGQGSRNRVPIKRCVEAGKVGGLLGKEMSLQAGWSEFNPLNPNQGRR